MSIDELVDNLQMIVDAGTYRTEEILHFIGRVICCEELYGSLQVVNTEERDAFQFVSEQLLRMVDVGDLAPRQQLEDLQNLMALQDMYINHDSSFEQAQNAYFTAAVDREVKKRTESLRKSIENYEAQVEELQERLAGKDLVIMQLRQTLAEQPVSTVDTDELQQLREENRLLKEKLEHAAAKLSPDASARPRSEKVDVSGGDTVTYRKKPMEKVAASDGDTVTVDQMPDDTFYLCGKSGTVSSDNFPQTKVADLTDGQCAQIRELGVVSCVGPMGQLGNLLHRYSGLEVLLLTGAVRCLDQGSLMKCPKLNMILFQDKNCVIEEKPERLKKVNLIADPGGWVERYAKKHGIRFTQLQE